MEVNVFLVNIGLSRASKLKVLIAVWFQFYSSWTKISQKWLTVAIWLPWTIIGCHGWLSWMTFLDDFHGWLDFAVYKLFPHIAVRLTISKWEDIKTLRSNTVITWNVCQKNDNPVCLNLLCPIWPYEPLCVTSSILIISALYKYVNEWNTVLLNKSDSDFTNTDRHNI